MSTKQMGRRKSESRPNQTQQIRIRKDLVEKLNWILWLRAGPGGTPESTATFLDAVIRPVIENEFALIQTTVEKIKAERGIS